MFEEKNIQFLDKTAKSFLSILKKIIKNYAYSKAEVDAAVVTGTAGLLSIRGAWDASGGSYPTTGGRGVAGVPKAGDGWNCSLGGTVGGIVFNAGDNIVALIDTPGQTAANWQKSEGNLGFTPENSSNKENTALDTSTSKYPTNRLVKEAVDSKQNTITAGIFGALISAFTAKNTPIDADEMTLADSAASGVAKKVTWVNVKATLKAYFDAIYLSIATAASTYATIVSPAFTGGITQVWYDNGNSGASKTIDPANGKYQKITLTNNCTITLAAVPASGREAEVILQILQDGTGGRIVTFANITSIFTGLTFAPGVNSTASSATMLNLIGKNDGWNGYAVETRIGVTDASVAPAGFLGEVISSAVAIGSATSLTTATAKTITSVTLTPGDWMVSGNVGFIAAAGTLPTVLTTSISQADNTQATSPNSGAFNQLALAFTAAGTNVLPLSPTRINVSATTTIYLVATATFTVSTLTAYGALIARRFR